MAGYCICGQYFHSPSARENASAHSYNIQPYFTFTGVIIYNYHPGPRAKNLQCVYSYVQCDIYNHIHSKTKVLYMFL